MTSGKLAWCVHLFQAGGRRAAAARSHSPPRQPWDNLINVYVIVGRLNNH